MAFAEDEIEDGTGLPTALVYEDPETAAAWLSRRGMTAFASASAQDREVAMLNGTRVGETALRDRFRGIPITTDQGLLFPALGAYDSKVRLLPPDSTPEVYLQGLRLLCEASADGSLMRFAGGPRITSESFRSGSRTYAQGIDLNSLRENHAEAWRLISAVFPGF